MINNNQVRAARVALVHDWLNQMGGAENVLEELVALMPGAPLYTSIYAPERMPDAYRTWDIRTSFMQHLPGVTTHHQRYLPLYPLAFSRFRLNDYDLVLSNKSGFCHGIGLGTPRPLHVCYCLTPTRFLWLYEQYRQREQIGGVVNAAATAYVGAVAPLGLCRGQECRSLHCHQSHRARAHPAHLWTPECRHPPTR